MLGEPIVVTDAALSNEPYRPTELAAVYSGAVGSEDGSQISDWVAAPPPATPAWPPALVPPPTLLNGFSVLVPPTLVTVRPSVP
jgi:hypothetical protein